jgi:L-aminopeptidase/D-esterase-like protein
MGATVGKAHGQEYAMKGGVGTFAVELQGEEPGQGPWVGAIAVANCLGDVVDPGSGEIIAGAYDRTRRAFMGPGNVAAFPTNTTLAVVATDALLDREGACKVAQMAQDGIARAVRPAHTMYDGDVVFVLSTGTRLVSKDRAAHLTAVGAAAAEMVAAAILRAVEAATTLGGCPGAQEVSVRAGS